MTESGTLTARQLQALPRILSSKTNEEAARRARISSQTLYTWLAQPEFKTELRRQRSKIVADALDRLKGGMVNAVAVLFDLLDSPNEQVRPGVANDLLRIGIHVMELQDLEDRMGLLEKRFRDQEDLCR